MSLLSLFRKKSLTGEQAKESNIEELIAVLKSGDGHARLSAVQELGTRMDLRAVEPLILKLKDKEDYVRWNAAQALGKLNDKRAIEPLTSALNDKHPLVQKDVINALKQFDDPMAKAALARSGHRDTKPIIEHVKEVEVNKQIHHRTQPDKIQTADSQPKITSIDQNALQESLNALFRNPDFGVALNAFRSEGKARAAFKGLCHRIHTLKKARPVVVELFKNRGVQNLINEPFFIFLGLTSYDVFELINPHTFQSDCPNYPDCQLGAGAEWEIHVSAAAQWRSSGLLTLLERQYFGSQ